MKKKILFIIMIIILIIPTTIFGFAEELREDPKPEMSGDAVPLTNNILGTVQWFGYAIAIGMLLYIAIKYMLSAADEKANLKQTLINWVIGAVVVCGVTALFTGLIDFLIGEDEGIDGVGGRVDKPGPKPTIIDQIK